MTAAIASHREAAEIKRLTILESLFVVDLGNEIALSQAKGLGQMDCLGCAEQMPRRLDPQIPCHKLTW